MWTIPAPKHIRGWVNLLVFILLLVYNLIRPLTVFVVVLVILIASGVYLSLVLESLAIHGVLPDYVVSSTCSHFLCELFNGQVCTGDGQYVTFVNSAKEFVGNIIPLLCLMLPIFIFYRTWFVKSKHAILTIPTPREGVDDLAVMAAYYKDADEVTVYAGDFNWVQQCAELEHIIFNLAENKKIKFISHKSKGAVQKGLGPRFNALCDFFVFDSKAKVLCSLVKKDKKKMLLYKIKERDFICVLTETDKSKYLVQTIESLMNCV